MRYASSGVIAKSHWAPIAPQLDRMHGFHDMFNAKCEQHAEKVAMICGSTGHKATYAELLKNTDHFAALLYHRYSVRRGQVVTILSQNTINYVCIFQAILRLGGIVSTINPTATADEISKQLQVSKSVLLIAHHSLTNVADDAAAMVASQQVRVMTLAGVTGACPEKVDLPIPSSDLATKANLHDVAVLPFSSGTTGLPKGVQLTNRCLLANILQGQVSVGFQESDVLMSVLPFYHIYGMVTLLHQLIHIGGSQVVLPKFDMQQYMKLVEQHRATLLFVVPPMAVGFVKHPFVKTVQRDSVRLIFSGAAPLGKEVQLHCQEVFPTAKMCQGYGMTEASPLITMIPLDRPIRYGSVGCALPDTELRVVQTDENDVCTDVPRGSTGELWARGPQVMKGYLREEDTAKTLTKDGWLKTGDLACMDEDGYVYITDRMKELIKYKGFQVAPAEVEQLLVTHHVVQEAIVFGLPEEDGSGNELPTAHIVLKPDFKDNEQVAKHQLQEYLAKHLSHYKQLKGGIRVVSAIPKTASGKLLRRVAKKEEETLRSKGH
jgi:acyl-CoA synthetase (AMP-forming)/AMP-acid ligase II